MTTPEKESILGGKAAVALGSVLLVGFAALAWLTSLDRQERGVLEKFHEPSAAGDPAIVLPAGAGEGGAPVPVLRREGVVFYGEDIVAHSDGTLMKVGKDDTGEIQIYQRERRNKLQPELFVKLGPGRFMEVAPDTRKAPPSQSISPPTVEEEPVPDSSPTAVE